MLIRDAYFLQKEKAWLDQERQRLNQKILQHRANLSSGKADDELLTPYQDDSEPLMNRNKSV